MHRAPRMWQGTARALARPFSGPNRSGSDPSKKEAFADMNLHEIDLGPDARVQGRVRQHVNPLKRELQVVTEPPNWAEVFGDPSLPLVVDIGCGYGRFLLKLARVHAAPRNYLGIEIRTPIIVRANEWARQIGLEGVVHFARANATISFANMLRTYPGPIELVTIQYPDPHVKKRHHKRRTVQPQLCRDIANVVPAGAHVFVQSDVLSVAENIRDTFELHAGRYLYPDPAYHTPEHVFQEATPDEPVTPAEVDSSSSKEEDIDETGNVAGGQRSLVSPTRTWAGADWLTNNPIEVPTEREVFALERGGRAYRFMLVRNAVDAT